MRSGDCAGAKGSEPTRDAVLLMVHQLTPALRALVEIMDTGQFDFYIHVDAKAEDFDFATLRGSIRRGRLEIVGRVRVEWGSPSMVKAELNLFEAALRGGDYRYFHLLSGADMPLRSGEEIYRFFSGRRECFLDCEPMEPFRERIEKYHPAWLLVAPSAPATFANRFRRLIYRVIMRGERMMRLRRRAVWRSAGTEFRPVHGSQWASLPREAVEYLVGHRRLIRRIVRHTFVPDEMYKQTILTALPERFLISTPVEGDLRYIDWRSDSPHPATLTPADYPEIKASGKDLFARKISSDIEVFRRFFGI